MARKQSGTKASGRARNTVELERIQSVLTDALASGRDGLDLARLRADLLDDLLRSHFEAACASIGLSVERAPLALAAAGSYGRAKMGLHSDVDVRLVVDGSAAGGTSHARTVDGSAAGGTSHTRTVDGGSALARSLADAFLYPLWDAGLDVGHQLATPSDLLTLAAEDVSTATAVLDLRPVAGDAAIVRDLVAKLTQKLRFGSADAEIFVRALEDGTRKRHERYGDSVYLLEPEVKLGAGGLRDLEVARWMLAPHAPPSADGQVAADPLMLLVEHGALDRRDVDAALTAEAFVWRVRNRLHALANRRSDRLAFDAQEVLARALGYVTAGGDEASDEGTERFMQDHYVHARAISRVRDRAASLATRKTPRGAGRPRDVGRGLVIDADGVALAEPDSLASDPAIALRAYDACLRLDAAMAERSRDAIARAMGDEAVCAALRSSGEAASMFVALLCTIGEAPALGASVARELHDTGVLLAMIPEFLPVTGRVHHDVYHVLTVDVHSVAAVDCLRDLARGELASAHPLASRLAAEVTRPRPLFLATLLHDVGKGHGRALRRHHSASGAELCDVILPRLGFTAEETADARALVLDHLTMYHLATRRDLDDAATVDELCRVVRGRGGLRDLYLLTLVDITTTSPAAMTPWKAHMLEELFLRADARLAGTSAPADVERARSVSDEVAKVAPDASAFAASMTTRYLLATSPASIAMHAQIARRRGAASAAVGLGPSHPSRTDVEVCVVARDRHGLLARIAAALAASRLEVAAAHVNTRTSGDGREAVDVFFVRDPSGGYEEVARKIAAVERDLVELCEDRVKTTDLVSSRLGSTAPWAARKTPDVRTRVVIDERTSPHATIIEIIAKDEPGLLFRLALALEESLVGITFSKINTEGTKVADVFYVQELDGRKVEGKARLDDIRRRLIEIAR